MGLYLVANMASSQRCHSRSGRKTVDSLSKELNGGGMRSDLYAKEGRVSVYECIMFLMKNAGC